MNDDPQQGAEQPGDQQPGAEQPGDQQQGAEQPTEEEMRRRIEEQLRKVRVQDLLLESVASVLNLSARRIAKEDERDLGQARVGIEAVRAVVDLLDPEPAEQVRAALSEVQMLYAKAAGGGEGGGGPDERGGEAPGAPPKQPPGGAKPPATGPGPAPSKLWTPRGN